VSGDRGAERDATNVDWGKTRLTRGPQRGREWLIVGHNDDAGNQSSGCRVGFAGPAR
jgi:hypothetical protein